MTIQFFKCTKFSTLYNFVVHGPMVKFRLDIARVQGLNPAINKGLVLIQKVLRPRHIEQTCLELIRGAFL